MITILALLVIIVVLYKIWTSPKSSYNDKENKIGNSFFCVFFGGSIASLICLPILAILNHPEIKRIDHSQKIYSLRNSESISGSFFLGSGRIEGAEYYYTFIENGRGGFYRQKLLASDCYIFQDTDTSPFMSWQTVIYRPHKLIHIWPQITWEKQTLIDLHVPKNTIIEEYKLN